MKVKRFEGWIIICPRCKEQKYISNDEMFDLTEGQKGIKRIVVCHKCGKKFKVYKEAKRMLELFKSLQGEK